MPRVWSANHWPDSIVMVNLSRSWREEIPSLANGGLSPDGTTVTWRLKQGVVWHDGKPFTADDVIFTWEYAADPATAAVSKSSYQNIARIDKLGDHTLKVVFRQPTPFWYDAFFASRGHILPKHLFALLRRPRFSQCAV